MQSIASNAKKIDWFDIISECGYYDQSQLIHDFKHYINLSPVKYLSFQQDICNPT
ncbi:MAG TPA: AraC family transcriptional regulator [Arachidicoccus sp.]